MTTAGSYDVHSTPGNAGRGPAYKSIGRDGYRSTPRTARKGRGCDSCRDWINPGDRYIEHVSSPRTDLGSDRWARMSECSRCACRYGRGGVLGIVAHGWHHATRSGAIAHCFDQGYPLCQDSDPGDPVGLGERDRLIGKLCETCRAVMVSRLRHAFRAREAVPTDA